MGFVELTNGLLAHFDLTMDCGEATQGATVYHLDGQEALVDQSVCGVRGGEPLLVLADGGAVMSRIRLGEGQLIVYSGAATFSNAEMGDTSVRPTQRQLLSSQTEFWLLSEILGLKGGPGVTP